MIRAGIYALLALVFAAGVFLRSQRAELEALREVVSINGEWEKFGKPVDAHRVARGVMVFTTRVSGILKEGRRMEADVTPMRARDLRPGQSFSGCGRGLFGTVSKVSASSNLNTGLHEIELQIQKGKAPGMEAIVAACVKTKETFGVLRVRREAVRSGDGGSYVWVVDEGKAAKKKLKFGEADDRFYRVVSGLSTGDVVIVDGWRNLKEGDRVRIRRLDPERDRR